MRAKKLARQAPPGNTQQQGTPSLTSPDGVIPERVKNIERDESGKIIKGNGYIVKYGQERASDGSRKPDRQSFVQGVVELSKLYANEADYGIVALNALKMGMTQGDGYNQAKGLLRVFAEKAEERKKKRAQISDAVYEFFGKLDPKATRMILTDGEEAIQPFGFHIEFDKFCLVARNAGLLGFLDGLRTILANGKLYPNFQDFIEYVQGLLKGMKHNKVIIDLLRSIRDSPLTLYEKHSELIKTLEMMDAIIKKKERLW